MDSLNITATVTADLIRESGLDPAATRWVPDSVCCCRTDRLAELADRTSRFMASIAEGPLQELAGPRPASVVS